MVGGYINIGTITANVDFATSNKAPVKLNGKDLYWTTVIELIDSGKRVYCNLIVDGSIYLESFNIPMAYVYASAHQFSIEIVNLLRIGDLSVTLDLTSDIVEIVIEGGL